MPLPIDITGTARLRARGMIHQAAFFRTVLSADLPLNHAIYSALMEIERLASLLPIELADVSSARALRVGMSECLDGAMRTPRAKLAQIAIDESMDKGNRPAVVDVASLAAAILDSAGFGGDYEWGRTVNRSWFVNLENMFERAVRLATQSALPAYEVTGPIAGPWLFGSPDRRYRANPDVVIRGADGMVTIGDAKYKDLEGWPSAADVYELVAHASAYGASKAFLAYPTAGEKLFAKIGLAATGCEVWFLTLPLQLLDETMASFAIELGLSVPTNGLTEPAAA